MQYPFTVGNAECAVQHAHTVVDWITHAEFAPDNGHEAAQAHRHRIRGAKGCVSVPFQRE